MKSNKVPIYAIKGPETASAKFLKVLFSWATKPEDCFCVLRPYCSISGQEGTVYDIQANDGIENTDKLSTDSVDKTSKIQSVKNSSLRTDISQNKLQMNADAISSRIQSDNMLYNSIAVHHERNLVIPEHEKCEKRLPVAIVIGVDKGGTRELLDFLRLHPHVEIFSSIKNGYELPYFKKYDYYKRGVDYLKSLMPCSYSNQITLMKDATYFIDLSVPERIKTFNASIKLILIVREPIARAISDFTFKEYKKNVEGYNYKFENNISSSVLTRNGSTIDDKNYLVSHSTYDTPMMVWLKYFSLSQFLIIESNELIHNPLAILKKVEDFLGLGSYITSDMFAFNKEKGFYCIKSNLSDTGMACYAGNRGRKPNITVPADTRSKLEQFFKIRNDNFFKLIGKSLDWNYS